MRRLREDDAFARNRAGDQGDVFGKAAALYFLDRIHGWDAENGGTTLACFFNDPGNLLAGDKRANRIVDGNEFSVVRDMLESGGNRFLATSSASNHADGLAKLFFTAESFDAGNLVGARGEDDVDNEFAGSQAAEGMEEDG